MVILGINAYHGDAAAAVVVDGQLVAAVEEERFRRVKHWAGLPAQAMRACLDVAGVRPADVDRFAVSRNPRAHLLRKAWLAARAHPGAGLARDRARNWRRIADAGGAIAGALGLDPARVQRRLHRVEHHPAHLASAFFVSPFEEAACASIDGFGDFVSTSQAVGRGRRLETVGRVFFPHSLGLLYLALTQYLGFPRYGDEYKVMGLAPYGAPDHVDRLRRLVRLTEGGGFELDLAYFAHWPRGARMTWEDGEPTMEPVWAPALERLLGPARRSDGPLEPRHEAIAASLQVVFEEAVFHVLGALHARTGLRRLCLAGGCAMNSVANGKIRERTPFEEVYVQPAAGDAGTALGAAFHVWHRILGRPRAFVMEHAYWGPAFDEAEIERELAAQAGELARGGCRVARHETEDDLCRWTAERIADGKVVGWFQGRMEWGARALGNRSIVADPRRPDMREIINAKIKLREKFRPFAPSVLEEAVDEYFAGAVPDPFMIQVYPVRPERRAVIPAVTHVDGSGRLQSVSRHGNPLYWQLIKAFEKRTGVPVVLNTSFNENEPIVHRPAEALACFLRTRMDVLVMGRHAVEKGA
jgi:carbamoyltransferase